VTSPLDRSSHVHWLEGTWRKSGIPCHDLKLFQTFPGPLGTGSKMKAPNPQVGLESRDLARGKTTGTSSCERSFCGHVDQQSTREYARLHWVWDAIRRDEAVTSGASIKHATTCLGGSRFHCSRDRLVAQLFFSSKPVLHIFSVFAAALKIQLMSSASDLLSRWFSASKHGYLLAFSRGQKHPPPQWEVLPSQPRCPQEQSISGFFTIASHCKLQYLPEAVRHEQTGCAHFSAFTVVISILLDLD
jgi:hypothetical protein